jgi:hypothetical protein
VNARRPRAATVHRIESRYSGPRPRSVVLVAAASPVLVVADEPKGDKQLASRLRRGVLVSGSEEAPEEIVLEALDLAARLLSVSEEGVEVGPTQV